MVPCPMCAIKHKLFAFSKISAFIYSNCKFIFSIKYCIPKFYCFLWFNYSSGFLIISRNRGNTEIVIWVRCVHIKIYFYYLIIYI